MSHYDCTNCGATEGIAYGICESCTPKKVLDVKKNERRLHEKATKLFEDNNRENKEKFIKEYMKDNKE